MASTLASANGIEAALPGGEADLRPFGCGTARGHLQEASSRIHTGHRRAGAGSEKGGVAGTAPKV